MMGRFTRFSHLVALMTMGLMMGPLPVWAGNTGIIGQRDGYIFDVEEEKDLRIVEVVFQPLAAKREKPLQEAIFEPELKKEFVNRYEQEFGRTEVERNVDASSRYDQIAYSPGVRVTVEEDSQRKQVFGEFMIRRLGEHHIDGYFRSNPSVRPVYELKQRISNLNLKVKKGYKFKINYSYAGNAVDLRMENPYEIDNKVILQMDPSSFGPSEVQEAILNLGYNVNKKVKVSSHYLVKLGEIQFVTQRQLSGNMSASVSGSSRPENPSGLAPEERVLFGLTWTD